MSSAVDTFLSRFPKVLRSGGQAMVQCPSHEDKTASLGVTEGADGRVLLKCFAGCPTDAIVAAMGLSLSDLFDAPIPTSERRELASYDYLAADGTLVYQVVRFEPKDFRQRRPDGYRRRRLPGGRRQGDRRDLSFEETIVNMFTRKIL